MAKPGWNDIKIEGSFKESIKRELEEGGSQVLDLQVYEGDGEIEAYAFAAVRERDGEVCGVTCLLKHMHHHEDTETLYLKEFHDIEGPYAAFAPVRILRLLSPTSDPEALAWRAQCRAFWRTPGSRRHFNPVPMKR
ncbi:conserved hypothetical protein [Hyphomicrobiales bacterium]|jgi:hypothetical protein|nr:conserved hypothetical protein [Hyphomicrobiales bacterium]CAH1702536.1 conserved hypothetical protein [Hyphomicrobiales bacterium]CAI0346738.1 conserved hypothetical protein [Hyphomicrobiales bacterium]